MTQTEFLKSTLDYYSENPNESRCYSNRENRCYYSPKNAEARNSEGCAIGRHLIPSIQEALDLAEFEGGSSIKTILSVEEAAYLIPEWMRNLGIEFLSEIQKLHDSNYNWDDYGLSGLGKNRVNSIIRQWDLDIPEYKF